jgi:hypothetical protein
MSTRTPLAKLGNMLETTYFAGEPPNRKLVYELRKRALHGVELPELLALIAHGTGIPRGETGCMAIAGYLRLAFGARIPQLKELAANIERTEDGYIINDTAVGDAVVAQIEANRNEWSDKLQPDQL